MRDVPGRARHPGQPLQGAGPALHAPRPSRRSRTGASAAMPCRSTGPTATTTASIPGTRCTKSPRRNSSSLSRAAVPSFRAIAGVSQAEACHQLAAREVSRRRREEARAAGAGASEQARRTVEAASGRAVRRWWAARLESRPLLCPAAHQVCERAKATCLAERGGFEPPVRFAYTRFPSVLLKPLGHLSERRIVQQRSRSRTGRAAAGPGSEGLLPERGLIAGGQPNLARSRGVPQPAERSGRLAF